MIAPCPNKIVCPPGAGDLGVEFPFANLTSEAIDRRSWIGQNTGFVWWPPPIGSNWTVAHCLGVCESFISQEDADICAALNNLLCLDGDDWGTCPPPDPCPPPPPPPPPPPGGGPSLGIPPYTLFTNSIQTCTVNCIDGSPFTYQVAAGMFGGPSQEAADRIAASFACRAATEKLVCLGEIIEWGCENEVYFSVLQATAPANVTVGFTVVSGSLPPGLSLTQFGLQAATISGIPTATGHYTFRIRATDSLLNFMEKNYTISILGILNTSPLPDATEGVFYFEILASAGGTGGVSYSVSSGALPAGLNLDGTGFISGSPTADGTFNFTIRMTDSSSPARSCDKDFTLLVNPGDPFAPQAWWPFLEAATPFTDTAAGLLLEPLLPSTGTVTITAGKVTPFGLLLEPGAPVPSNQGMTLPQSSAVFQTTGSFTLSAWFNEVGIVAVGDTIAVIYTIYNGVWVNGVGGPPFLIDCRFQFQPGVGAEISFRGAGFLPVGVPDIVVPYVPGPVYQLIVFGFDSALGQSFYSLNGGPIVLSGGGFAWGPVHTTGRIELDCARNAAGIKNCAYDEVNFFNRAVSAADIANLWNGGAGRTWP